MFEEFVSVMKDDAVLPMIGSLQQHLPSTCCCQLPDCSQLASLSSPVTKQSQLSKFFIKSDEIRQEFMSNSNRMLDWVFRNSKMLNEEIGNMAVLGEAISFIESSGDVSHFIKSSLKVYILKWISFSFTDNRTIDEIHSKVPYYSNKFIKFFIDSLLNSPFIEDKHFVGKALSFRQYLHFGNILQAAFNFTSKNHKIREKKVNCKCCICTSNFSSEDIEFIFVKNIVKNIKSQGRKENIIKLSNFLKSIDKGRVKKI